MNKMTYSFVFVVFLLLPLVGCSTLNQVTQQLADLPTQYVMVSVSGTSATGTRIISEIFPPQGGHRSIGLEPTGGLSPLTLSRPRISPGIGANNDLYLVASWCATPGFNSLCFFVSENGRRWSLSGPLILAAASSDISNKSGPSVTYFPVTRTWFVVYRSELASQIKIAEFGVACTRDNRGDCTIDSEGIAQYSVSPVQGFTALPGSFDTNYPPSISYLNQELILAFVPTGGVANVSTARSTDGVTFTTPVTATQGGSPVPADAGAPYLSNSVGELFMATGRTRGGGSDIEIYTSSDSVNWTGIRTIASVGSILASGMFDPAIAGPASEMLVAFKDVSRARTKALVPNGSTVFIATDTTYRVGLAHGPGPIDTERHSCAEPLLTVTGRTGTSAVTLGYSESDTLSVNGDFELQCGSFVASAGCPDNTRYANIIRSSGSGVIVECWRVPL